MTSQSRIEKLKLQATYFNNIGVGLTVAGILVPFLALLPHLGAIVETVISGQAFRFQNLSAAIGTVLAMVLALRGGRHFHRLALERLSKLDEPTPQPVAPDQS